MSQSETQTTPPPQPTVLPRWRRALPGLREVLILSIGFGLYNLGRLAISDHEKTARANAADVRSLQDKLFLPDEATLQEMILDHDWLVEFVNNYYVHVHFPLMLTFLAVGLLWRPLAHVIWVRNLLILQTGGALVLHLVYPLAPPRMFPQWGFVDTQAIWGPSAYGDDRADMTNQFAAMPSMHVGWAVLIAVVLWRTGPKILAAFATLHAVFTAWMVMVTANHWWLDGIVGVALLGVALLLVPAPERQSGDVRGSRVLRFSKRRKPRSRVTKVAPTSIDSEAR